MYLHYVNSEKPNKMVFEAERKRGSGHTGCLSPFEKPERFKELKNTLFSKKWVVHVKEPIKKPEYVLEYLGRYTHRVAI